MRLHPLKFHGPEPRIDNMNSLVIPLNSGINLESYSLQGTHFRMENTGDRITLFQALPGFSYKYECDSQANTFCKPLQGRNPLPKKVHEQLHFLYILGT